MKIRKSVLHILVVITPVLILVLLGHYSFDIYERIDKVQYSVAEGFKPGKLGRIYGYKYSYEVFGERYHSILGFGYNPITKKTVNENSLDPNGKYVVRFPSFYKRSGEVLLGCRLHDSVKAPKIPWDTIPKSLLINTRIVP